MKIQVQSAHDNAIWYDVDMDAHTCSCQSFEYRGNCKHFDHEKAPIWREVTEAEAAA